jgi:carbon-monoxide dehydrogenase small subunit
MYDSGRYFTVTGNHLKGTPKDVKARNNELEMVHDEYIGDDRDDDQQPVAGHLGLLHRIGPAGPGPAVGSPDLGTLRDELGLTGTRIGCETSSCGCCTVLMDGERVKSCTLLAVQADGRELTTVEGLADDDLTDVQQAFSRNHALQCGYCTAGMVVSATALLEENPDPTRAEIEHGIACNLCRCTGYRFIVDAIEEVAASDPAGDGGGGGDAE